MMTAQHLSLFVAVLLPQAVSALRKKRDNPTEVVQAVLDGMLPNANQALPATSDEMFSSFQDMQDKALAIGTMAAIKGPGEKNPEDKVSLTTHELGTPSTYDIGLSTWQDQFGSALAMMNPFVKAESSIKEVNDNKVTAEILYSAQVADQTSSRWVPIGSRASTFEVEDGSVKKIDVSSYQVVTPKPYSAFDMSAFNVFNH